MIQTTQQIPTVGKKYKHKLWRNIVVTGIEPTTDKVMPYIIKFCSDFNTELSQGINGFNFNVGITKTPWI